MDHPPDLFMNQLLSGVQQIFMSNVQIQTAVKKQLNLNQNLKQRRHGTTEMSTNTVILAPHSYVVVHRKQPNIYDVYDIETGEWILSRTSPDNILQIFSEWCCTFKFIDENVGEVYEGKGISN